MKNIIWRIKMAKCTRCGSEIVNVRYVQLVDENRNWAVRTEQMKPICEDCGGDVISFANTPIQPRKKSGVITKPILEKGVN